MSTLWWGLSIVVAYFVVGWGAAWVEAIRVVRERNACKQCGRPIPDYVCDLHKMDDLGLLMFLWPLALGILAFDGIHWLWDRINPGRVVEERARRNAMHVIVDSPTDKEEQDD